jgi:hypothetical protein
MKHIIAAVTLILFTATFALAVDDVIILKAPKKGNISFPHKKHKEELKIGCKVCHVNGIGKIPEQGMAWGHKTCKACHETKGNAACNVCHEAKK